MGRAYLSRRYFISYKVAVEYRLEPQSSGSLLGRTSKRPLPWRAVGVRICWKLSGSCQLEWPHKASPARGGWLSPEQVSQVNRQEQQGLFRIIQRHFYCILFFISELITRAHLDTRKKRGPAS